MGKDKDKNKTNYPLRVDKTLWKKFKVKCAEKDVTMLEAITKFIKGFVK